MLRHELIELAENGLLAVNMQGMMIGLDNYLEMMVGGEPVLINKRVNMRVMQKLHANYDVYAKDGKSGEYSIIIPAYVNGDRMVMFCLDGGVEFSTINEGVGGAFVAG